MIEFDKQALKEYLAHRKTPTKTPKDLVYNGITIKNVPVIVHKEGSVEFSISFNTCDEIYNMLLKNNNEKDVLDFNRKK